MFALSEDIPPQQIQTVDENKFLKSDFYNLNLTRPRKYILTNPHKIHQTFSLEFNWFHSIEQF